MHLPSVNAEHNSAVLHQFIRDNPLGILTTAIRSTSHPLLQSSHIPWVVDSEANNSGTGLGRLRGHIARQNPQAQAIIEACTTASATSESPSTSEGKNLEEEVLVLFNGPAHHYVTPHFYVATKPTTGKVVPTWDYEAVQVYGKARIYHDSHAQETATFLTTQIADLTKHAEGDIMGYGRGDGDVKAWEVADAPERYVGLLMKNIIGIEIEITSMGGRWKMSQEKKKDDRDGVVNGFRGMKSALGQKMAEMVESRAVVFDRRKEELR